MKVSAASALSSGYPRVFLSHNPDVINCLRETFADLHFPNHDGDDQVRADVRYDITLISR